MTFLIATADVSCNKICETTKSKDSSSKSVAVKEKKEISAPEINAEQINNMIIIIMLIINSLFIDVTRSKLGGSVSKIK